jgi:sarcosine oxidase
MRKILATYLPKGNGEFLRALVCLYTNTPDGHFILDRHPSSPNVIIASPCSGHGFKFSSAIGELIAGMVIENQPAENLFSLRRFHASPG